MAVIRNLVGGEILTEGEAFFLKNADGRMEFSLVAEGIRKPALMALLIRNGSLRAGTVLFWDEPEANLNPGMMPAVARALSTLASLGVQVFAATHSYAFLKEIELQSRGGKSPRFFLLFASGTREGIQVRSAERIRPSNRTLLPTNTRASTRLSWTGRWGLQHERP